MKDSYPCSPIKAVIPTAGGTFLSEANLQSISTQLKNGIVEKLMTKKLVFFTVF